MCFLAIQFDWCDAVLELEFISLTGTGASNLDIINNSPPPLSPTHTLCVHVQVCVCVYVCVHYMLLYIFVQYVCLYYKSVRDQSLAMLVYLINFALFTDISVCKFLHGLAVVWPETFFYFVRCTCWVIFKNIFLYGTLCLSFC